MCTSLCFQNCSVSKLFTLRQFDADHITIGHSKTKLIVQSGLLESEIGPEVLQSSVQTTCVLQERQRHKSKATDYISILSFC